MRRIKKFENFRSEDYYQEITENEYDSLANQMVSFEEKYLNILKDLIIVEYSVLEDSLNKNIKRLRIDSNGLWATIRQCEDEWFIVFYSISKDQFQQYKCDQFEGLIRFLKDKDLIR